MAKKEKVESIEIIESPEALQQEVSKVTELVYKNKSSKYCYKSIKYCK